MKVLVLIALLCDVAVGLGVGRGGWHHQLRHQAVFKHQSSNGTVKQFTQLVDHYDPTNTATFQESYYIDTSFARPSGPVLFVQVGEEPMAFAIPGYSQPPLTTWAQSLGAIIIALEHRYYGTSTPVPDLTLPNMKFLSSQQSLADSAYFAAEMRKQPMLAGRKWISIGCSYPGALSAWLRNKYPDLIVASIAGSAVVHAQKNFPEYAATFANATNPRCASILHKAALDVLAMSSSDAGRAKLQQVFNTCQPITDQTLFQFFWQISFNLPVQPNVPYEGYPLYRFCAQLENSTGRALQIWSTTISYTTQSPCLDLSETGQYDPKDLANTSISNFVFNDRSWAWQLCTEFGWFLTNDPKISVFPWNLPLAPLQAVCSQAFAPNLDPHIPWTNVYYGDRNFESSSNILFLDGLRDPWNSLTDKKSFSNNVDVVLFNSSHCAPFLPPSASDPPDLTAARDAILTFMKRLL